VVLLCIGNKDRGDDGFGPAVAARVGGRLACPLFDGGAAPENELPRIAAVEPALVIIVDAAHFGGRPGELRLMVPDELTPGGVSTHTGSPALLAEFLKVCCGARTLLLVAQPLRVEFGAPMSPQMERAVDDAAALLMDLLASED